MYLAKYIPEAREDIRALSKNVRNVLRKEIENVVLRNPVGCSKELVGEPLRGFRSFHCREAGDYRVVFRVYEDLKAVAIVGVGPKGADPNVYARLASLASTGRLADSVLSTMRMLGDAGK